MVRTNSFRYFGLAGFGSQVAAAVNVFLERVKANMSSREIVAEKIRQVGIRYSVPEYLNSLKKDLDSGDKKSIMSALNVVDRIIKSRQTGSDFGVARFRKELFDLIRNDDDEIRSMALNFVILAPGWN